MAHFGHLSLLRFQTVVCLTNNEHRDKADILNYFAGDTICHCLSKESFVKVLCIK